MDAAAFEAELKRDGYTNIETRSGQPNIFSPLHSHPCDVRALVTTGEVTLYCEGATRTYRAGDTLILAAGCEHTEQIGPEGYTYIVGRRLRD